MSLPTDWCWSKAFTITAAAWIRCFWRQSKFFFTIFICICKCNEQGIIALVSLILKGSSKKNGKFSQSPLKQILLTERKRKFLFSPYLGSICVRTLPLSLPHFLLQKPWETNQRQGKTSSESKDRRKTQKDKVMADQATFTAPSC